MSHIYMAMDGRAAYDTDAAMVLECIGEVSEKQAWREFKRCWGGMGACLVRYDIGKDEIYNPVVMVDARETIAKAGVKCG
jgi:hypothetical protein